MSASSYICMRIRQYVHICMRIHMCLPPPIKTDVSASSYICIRILLYMCPHTAIQCRILLYMCPHAPICVSAYSYIYVLIRLIQYRILPYIHVRMLCMRVRIRLPHTPIYASSYGSYSTAYCYIYMSACSAKERDQCSLKAACPSCLRPHALVA